MTREANVQRTKHGQATNPLYNTWKNMRERCHNERRHNFNRYGGRGITVCPEWDNDVAAFIDWAESHGYAPGLEIDRIDTDGNYEPSNCRWVTRKENQNNKKNNIRLTIDGETRTMTEWAQAAGKTAKAASAYKRRHTESELIGWLREGLMKGGDRDGNQT